MRMVEIIEKKRDGKELNAEEIRFFVKGYTENAIPDYQAAALLMAILWRGMTDAEVRELTLAMAYSGEVLNLKDVASMVVDKHSTGGVGDKVTFVVAPTVAACGLPVGKMSGRGLGFSGGTLDKLESIPGFTCNLSVAEFKAQLGRIGLVIAGQTANLAPADGKLYALRDVTGTVPSLPLIISSVMSKKIAAGADAIVLDVKMGSGAFMKTLADAEALAEGMVAIGKEVGRRVTALISDMNQPLGWAVGNALEVREAIAALHGAGPHDLMEHCLIVAAEMLYRGGVAASPQEGIELAREAINSGRAWQKFRDMVSAQGGDVAYIDNPTLLPAAPIIEPVPAPESGYLARVQTDEIGMTVVAMGGGRLKKGDPIDHAVGLVMHYKVGDYVERGTPLFTLHAASRASYEESARRVLAALEFSPTPVSPLPLFYRRIE